ncbi:DeoR/GlpR family DNA-binding transcription regulator [Clostridium ganghwense]|uniref:DeoR/GlpR family DNA-binding transcription regulator n=1 Tax=Clostridium ganghwense TaxID=312089 RepID=A0ABT4CQ26_9CLOT|nr:DeoR/GlpR family DNA-binding transcription regulator [Clostridium ganghwense]MCY6371139.1 DeoR/GlpR family DNA-binding transcription regulator [Clostridium ganghwense]
MLVVERMEMIKQILRNDKKIDINSLTSMLGVSDVTVRKDLDKLQEEGFLKKIHGGAILAESKDNFENEKIIISNLQQKEKIAEMAYKTIQKGESIFIGSGTTSYLLAQKIRKEDRISVVTNNVSALNILLPNCVNVVLIGGEVISQNGIMFTLGGKKISNSLEGVYVNKAFTSVTGVDLNAGLTVTKEFSVYIYKHISKITNNWTLMIDESKYNRIGLFYAASLDSPNCIITNKMDDQYKKEFDEKGIDVLICE